MDVDRPDLAGHSVPHLGQYRDSGRCRAGWGVLVPEGPERFVQVLLYRACPYCRHVRCWNQNA
ncbi:hypothetical protein D3C76_1368480 [compost metagenome]